MRAPATRAGKLKFRLDGKKLRGGWTLVRMHGRAGERQEPWLLIKEKDEAARPSAEYSVVEAEPKSVLSDRTIDDKPAATPKEAAGDDSRARTTAKKRRRRRPSVRRPRRRRARRRRARPTAAVAKTAAKRGSRAPAADKSSATAIALPAGAVKAKLPATFSPAAGDARHRDAGRRRLDLRDQVRRLPHRRAHRGRRRSPVHAPRQRLVVAHAGAGRGGARARHRLGLARRRDRRQRRARHARLQRAAERLRLVAHRCHPVLRLRPAVLRRPRPARPAAGRAARRPRGGCSTARRRRNASASARISTRARRSCCRTPAGCASRG